MSEVSSNKIALFIDGANLHFAAKALDFDIDYGRLLQEFRRRGALVRAYYYTALIENEEYASLRPLTDWLAYNGSTVVKRVRRWRGTPQVQAKHERRTRN